MIGTKNDKPTLYWISGSPPSWRVMLALTIKGIEYESRMLNAATAEHKTEDYLSINPCGQVPVLTVNEIVIRESIAILAFLDAAWPDKPIFGSTLKEQAKTWQAVMEFEANVRPSVTKIAQILFRGREQEQQQTLIQAANTLEAELKRSGITNPKYNYCAGEVISAADCVWYPAIAWVRRAIEKSKALELLGQIAYLLENKPELDAWCQRVESLEGFYSTFPPHWKAN